MTTEPPIGTREIPEWERRFVEDNREKFIPRDPSEPPPRFADLAGFGTAEEALAGFASLAAPAGTGSPTPARTDYDRVTFGLRQREIEWDGDAIQAALHTIDNLCAERDSQQRLAIKAGLELSQAQKERDEAHRDLAETRQRLWGLANAAEALAARMYAADPLNKRADRVWARELREAIAAAAAETAPETDEERACVTRATALVRQREHRYVTRDALKEAILAAFMSEAAVWEHTFPEGNKGDVIGAPDAALVAAAAIELFVVDLTAENARLRAELSELREEWRREIEARDRHADELDGERSIAAAHAQALADDLERVRAELSQVQKERDALKLAAGLTVDTVVSFAVGAIRNMLDTAHVARTQLRPQIARLEADLADTRRDLAAAHDRLDANGGIPDRYDDAIRERDEARAALTGEQLTVAEVLAVCQRAEAARDAAESALAALRTEVGKIADEYGREAAQARRRHDATTAATSAARWHLGGAAQVWRDASARLRALVTDQSPAAPVITLQQWAVKRPDGRVIDVTDTEEAARRTLRDCEAVGSGYRLVVRDLSLWRDPSLPSLATRYLDHRGTYWALRKLVELHDGPRDKAYEEAKPGAWQAAREAVAVVDLRADQSPAAPAVCRCPTNEVGDIRCHNCGERVNKRCWKCGTPRGAGPCPTDASRDTYTGGTE